MRRTAVTGVLGLVGLPLLGQAPAAAAPTEDVVRQVRVEASAWSWRRTVPAGSPVEEPSNVPEGDLAVAYDGRPDAPPAKATYLRLALGQLPTGAQVRNLLLTVPVDTAVQQAPASAVLVACRLTAPFRSGAGTDPAAMPAEDCADAAKGVYDASAAAFTFLVTGFASDWVSGTPNHGLVLRPDPAAAVPAVMPFSVTLKGADAVVGSLAVVAAPTPVVDPTLQPHQPAGVGAPPVVGGVLPPPAPTTGAVPPSVAVAPVPTPRPQAVAAPVLRQAQTRAPFRASPAGFAAGGVLGLLLLGLVGWALGEAADPRWFARVERRRLDRLTRGAVVIPAAVDGGAAALEPTPGDSAQPTQIRQGRRPRSTAASTVTYS